MASTFAGSRPSEKFGTHSINRFIANVSLASHQTIIGDFVPLEPPARRKSCWRDGQDFRGLFWRLNKRARRRISFVTRRRHRTEILAYSGQGGRSVLF